MREMLAVTGAMKGAGRGGDCALITDGRCLLYTSDAADERSSVDLGGRRIIKKKKNIKTHTGCESTYKRDIRDIHTIVSVEEPMNRNK